MRAGEMDRRITIEKNTPTRSATGEEKENWTTLATVWAQVRAVGGGERFRGAHIVAEATTSFVIRHRTDVTEKMRIQFDGDAYDIHHISEIGRREGLVIQASRRGP